MTRRTTDDSRDADEGSPLARVRRAKTEQVRDGPTRRVDGGAVAVGLVVAFGSQLVAAFALLLVGTGAGVVGSD